MTRPHPTDAMPCPVALIAQAMGLMSSYAAGGCSCGAQQALAQAVIERLHLLGRHPQLPESLQLAMRQTHGQWVALLQSSQQLPPDSPRPWVH